jgi:hypothetical protein
MAINLILKYPAQVIAGDLFYPWGKARNITVSGDGTGTPWEADLVNDWLGFFQSLLLESGQTPSNNPDKLGTSQYLDAIKYLTGNIVGAFNVIGSGAFTGHIFADYFAANSNGSIIGDGDGGGNNVLGNTRFVGLSSFENAVSSAAQVTVALGGIVTGNAATTIGNGLPGIIVQAGGIHVVAGASQFDDTVTHNEEIILANSGRIRKHVAYAPDANHTFAVSEGTVLIAKGAGFITAPRTWTLADGAEGSELKLINYSSQVITVHNSGGGSLLVASGSTVPAATGGGTIPSVLNLVWVNNGTYTGWSGA